MARGRKPTTMNRSDRYLGSYSYGNNHRTSVTDDLELSEEDIWLSPTEETYGAWDIRASTGCNTRVGGLSMTFEAFSTVPPPSSPIIMPEVHDGGGKSQRNLASSAPVNVPDWSKIYRVDSVESIHESDDEEEAAMMPPHEYLARRSRKSGGSVFEGVGRTLKGRELRRVRDAIWNQTGFYG